MDEIDRLLEEVLALQSLRSNHVVEVYDLVPTASEKEIGLVEEYIDGDDLDDFLAAQEQASIIDVNEFIDIPVPVYHR